MSNNPFSEWKLEMGEPEIEVSPEAVEELTKILSSNLKDEDEKRN